MSMWDRISVLSALLCVVFGAPLTTTPCPESCVCVYKTSGQFEARCNSLDFLNKLQPKQVNALVSLDLSSSNLTHLHTKLKKLRNLENVNLSNNNINDITELSYLPKLISLNLEGNHIKYFTANSLSKFLKHLDLSRNYLVYIPDEFKNFPNLKELDLSDNPISCSCDTIKERDLLSEAGVNLVKPIVCHSPEKLRGQLLQKVPCIVTNDNLFEQMQGDSPVDEGSGDDSTTIPEIDAEVLNNENKGYIKPDHDDLSNIEDEGLIAQIPSTSSTHLENMEVGSGFGSPSPTEEEEEEDEDEDYYEGSGLSNEYEEGTTTTPLPVKACYFDCSSPAPVEVNTTDLPDPDVIEEIKKGIEEIILPETTTTTTTTEASVEEVPIFKTNINKVDSPISQGEENEKINDPGEIREDKGSWNTNLIIIVGLIAIMMCLVAYSIIKKRKKRPDNTQPVEQEMKLLSSKPTNGGAAIPEKTPLMNGQNGNMNGKAVEEPIKRTEELDSKPEEEEEEEVALRKKKRGDENLLPETHRVTIQAKELTTPKTPLLVNRLKSDDGTIITTPDSH